MNISSVPLNKTASTNFLCASQRAHTLSKLNIKGVLELCVGPSLKVLELAYNTQGIQVTGNDIDIRWKHYYPSGNWIIGDALEIDYSEFDAIIFAPPLSNGCTGKREDSLIISKVYPSYYSFADKVGKELSNQLFILTLPGRSLSTKNDRVEYYKLINYLQKKFSVQSYKLKNKVTKYIDLYLRKEI